ncbi:MAG: BatA domain-containing protein, partial [Bryobacteraceae bacterium]
MGFLSPWFLAGIAAVGIPLYVHLLRQHRSVPHPFSSLMFFEKRTQSSVKHRRLMHLLLLALRLALLILLALAFANPYIKRAAAPAGEGNKHLVVAVDNSFSMRTAGRLEQAKQQAAQVLSGLRPGDRGQVIAFGSGVRLLTQPVESAAELQAAVQSITPSDGRISYGELSRTLRTLAQGAKLPIEVHLFSDMQKSSMPPSFSEMAMAGNTRLALHPVGDGKDPNYYVESVSAPPSIYQPKKVRIQTTVAGAGAPAREVAVSLALNGKVTETKNTSIPEGGRSTVEFFLQDAPYGLNRGEVRISSGDRLKEDDVFPFAMERKEASRVLFVYEERRSRGLLYYRAALDAAGDSAFAIHPVTAANSGGIDPKKYAFVVLSDVGS